MIAALEQLSLISFHLSVIFSRQIIIIGNISKFETLPNRFIEYIDCFKKQDSFNIAIEYIKLVSAARRIKTGKLSDDGGKTLEKSRFES